MFVSVRNIIQTFKDCGFSCRCLVSYEAGRQVYDRRHVFEQSEIRELRYAMGNTSEIVSSVNFRIFGHPVSQIHAHSRSSTILHDLPCPMSWSFQLLWAHSRALSLGGLTDCDVCWVHLHTCLDLYTHFSLFQKCFVPPKASSFSLWVEIRFCLEALPPAPPKMECCSITSHSTTPHAYLYIHVDRCVCIYAIYVYMCVWIYVHMERGKVVSWT